MADMFFGVNTSATADFKTGSPTVSISSGVATFSGAQTSDLMGVGAVIDYDTDNKKAYIVGKTSTSVWTVKTATGGTPGDIAGVAVNSISHPFSSLAAAETGAPGLLGSSNLVGLGLALHIACYNDRDNNVNDSTTVSLGGWTTDATNSLRFFTPRDEATECNLQQRLRNGCWQNVKYRMAGGTEPIKLFNNANLYFTLEGIAIASGSGSSNYNGINLEASANINITIRECLFLSSRGSCARLRQITGTVYFVNCVFVRYNQTAEPSIDINWNVNVRIYGCAFLGEVDNPIFKDPVFTSGTTVAQNNLFLDHLGAPSSNGLSGDHNIYRGISTGLVGDTETTQRNEELFEMDGWAEAWYVANLFPAAGSDLVGAGADLSAAPVDCSYDFDHGSGWRPKGGSWDVGPIEYDASALPAHVPFGVCFGGPADFKSASPTLDISSGVGTFSVAQADDLMGIGAEVVYNTTEKAYVVGKTSTSVWSLVKADGSLPGDVSGATVNSISHPFGSLAAATAGATALLGTTDLFESDIALSFPCYRNAADDTGGTASISGINGDKLRRVTIYCPEDAIGECNLSQRNRASAWDLTKYILKTAQPISVLRSSWEIQHVTVRGIQAHATGNVSPILDFNGYSPAIVVEGNHFNRTYSSSTTSQWFILGQSSPRIAIVGNIFAFIQTPGGVFCQNNSYSWVINNTIMRHALGSFTAGGYRQAFNNHWNNFSSYAAIDESEGNVVTGAASVGVGDLKSTQADSDLFTDVTGGEHLWDFLPKDGSDLRDNGAVLGDQEAPYYGYVLPRPSFDFDHAAGWRPQDVGWDAGAFEAAPAGGGGAAGAYHFFFKRRHYYGDGAD